jgi:quinoprotein dehydrogenase-associated probable ABC transporter substrate-binding protein
MSLRCLSLLLAFGLAPNFVQSTELRVCAEPDNLPFSNASQSGFENRIASVLAQELGATLVYSWQPQRRAFVRKTLGAGLCLLTTRPYYRSTYVFVYGKRPLRSFDDPALGAMRIGVQLPGNDMAATPPGHALAARGAVKNVIGFPVYGEHPAAQRIVEAVAKGELDAGVVWGPAAAPFAKMHSLSVSKARAPVELAELPFEFAIAVGVRRDAPELRDRLDAALARRQREVERILDEYAVPR